MAATATRTLKAVFDGDERKLTQAAKRSEAALKRFEDRGERTTRQTSKLSKVSSGAAGALGGLATKAGPVGAAIAGIGAAVVGPIAGLLAMSEEAAQLELSLIKARKVFGPAFKEFEKWAERGANAIGLTKIEAISLGAGIQDMLVPLGLTRDRAADLTARFMDLTGALAAHSEGTMTAADVSNVFQSAITGEFDSLQRLGVNINAARVERVADSIQKKRSTKLTEAQAKAIAVLTITERDSTDALENFNKTQKTAAGRIARTKAKLREKWQEIQIKMLPVIDKLWTVIEKKVIPVIERFVDWLASPEGQAAIDSWVRSIENLVNAIGDIVGAASSAISWLDRLFETAARHPGGVSGALSAYLADKIAGRAHGGPVESGRAFVVGEQGPELFVPNQSGRIVSNDQMGGPGVIDNHIYIGDEVVRVVRTEIKGHDRELRRSVGAVA